MLWPRNLLSILALPTMVTVAMPLWLSARYGLHWQPPADASAGALVAAGVLLLLPGLSLFVACVTLFWQRGRGTLAPWDPPTVFVASGPYTRVRHPMISGVFLILVAEACLLRAWPLAAWAAAFAVINATYIPLVEEPALVARFGDSYRTYARTVPRFLPFPTGLARTTGRTGLTPAARRSPPRNPTEGP